MIVENRGQGYYNDLLSQVLKNLVSQSEYSLHLIEKTRISDNYELKRKHIQAVNKLANLARDIIQEIEK